LLDEEDEEGLLEDELLEELELESSQQHLPIVPI
jgi:hypothetical protein